MAGIAAFTANAQVFNPCDENEYCKKYTENRDQADYFLCLNGFFEGSSTQTAEKSYIAYVSIASSLCIDCEDALDEKGNPDPESEYYEKWEIFKSAYDQAKKCPSN